MTKRAISKGMALILALVFVFSMLPGMTFALGAAAVCTAGTAEYESVQAAVDAVGTGTIKMIADSDENVTIPDTADITLNLNGFVLKAASDGSVIVNNGTLTITDSGSTEHKWVPNQTSGVWEMNDAATGTEGEDYFITTGGVITGGKGRPNPYDPSQIIGGGICNNGTLTMAGGNITSCSAGFGGGICSTGTLTMAGGNITSCSAELGGGIYSNDTLTMAGGNITSCRAKNGGGINCRGTLTMAGGSVTGCSASEFGGGIYNIEMMTMTGGSVTGCSASEFAGGVFVYASSNSIFGGTASVKGNTANGGTSNIHLQESSSGGKAILTVSEDVPFAEGAYVGVTVFTLPTAAAPAVITSNGTEADRAYIVPDKAGYFMKYNQTETRLELIPAPVCAVGGEPFESIGAAVDAVAGGTATGNVVMYKNTEENVTITADTEITLDLNGFVLKAASDGSVITNNGTLTVTDSGSTEHKWVLNQTSGVVEMDDAATGTEGEDYFVTTGGVITGGTGNLIGGDLYGGGIYNAGTLTMAGGTVIGNKGRYGGGICNDAGTLIMTGGSVTGNLGSGGGGIYSPGPMTMTGGTVSYNIADLKAYNGGENGYGSGGGVQIEFAQFIMTGGSITGNSAAGVNDFGGGGLAVYMASATISGGSISGNTSAVDGAGISCYQSGTLNIEGGMIGGDIGKFNEVDESIVINITGGLFELEPDKDYVASGYTLTDNSDSATKADYPYKVQMIYYPPADYDVSAAETENGSVAASPAKAEAGQQVTLTMTPDDGFALESLTVTNGQGNEIALTDNGDGTYSFTMPSGKVNVQAAFAKEATPDEVVPSPQKLTVDGEEVEVQAYNINGYNYLKIRDVAALLADSGKPFNVEYDAVRNAVKAVKGVKYIRTESDLTIGEDLSGSCVPSPQKVYVDNILKVVKAYNIGGYNYFKLRDLGRIFGFGVDYDDATNTGLITTK